MSHTELRRQNRAARHLCAACRGRQAKYQYRGHVRADRQHVLCFQCFRSAREQMRARQLKETLPLFPDPPGNARESLFTPRPAPLRHELTAREVEHRQRMLEYLQALSMAARTRECQM